MDVHIEESIHHPTDHPRISLRVDFLEKFIFAFVREFSSFDIDV